MTEPLFQDERLENMQLRLNKLYQIALILMVIAFISTIISIACAFMVSLTTALITTAFIFTIGVVLCFILFATHNICEDIEYIYYAQDYSL